MKNQLEIEDCCKPVVQHNGDGCPECATRGKTVSQFTISLFVRDPGIYLHQDRLPEGRYYMCQKRSCPVVYFDSGNGPTFTKDELRVRVWQKEDDPEVPVCYCFNNSVKSIQEELRKNGTTDVVARIGAEVRAGNCRCVATNPQGSCCLGNVVKAVKIAKESLKQEFPARERRIPASI